MKRRGGGRRAIAVVIGLVAALSGPDKAGAITDGVPDNGAHPNVGTVIWRGGDGVLFRSCSGTLISPTVFLTAAHCVALDPEFPGDEPVGVSFADRIDGEPSIYLPATGYAHPNFVWGHSNGWGETGSGNEEYDIAVMVLHQPKTDVATARLPTMNQLGQMNRKTGSRAPLSPSSATAPPTRTSRATPTAAAHGASGASRSRPSGPSTPKYSPSTGTTPPAMEAPATATRAARTSLARRTSSPRSPSRVTYPACRTTRPTGWIHGPQETSWVVSWRCPELCSAFVPPTDGEVGSPKPGSLWR